MFTNIAKRGKSGRAKGMYGEDWDWDGGGEGGRAGHGRAGERQMGRRKGTIHVHLIISDIFTQYLFLYALSLATRFHSVVVNTIYNK